MIRLYAPVAVAVVAIVSLTAWAAHYSDRFTSSSVTAEEFGRRFANVPKDGAAIGEWVGEDLPVEKATAEQAGAVSHVSRRYVNPKYPGRHVDLWLIVGHARDIVRHTPDICYPSQGYSQRGATIKYTVTPPTDEEHPAEFFSAKFQNESTRGAVIERVFWAWNGNDPEDGRTEWEAPESQKLHFGNNRALYKMYFTAEMNEQDEEPGKNLAVEFAKVLLPEVNRALFPERYGLTPTTEEAAEAPASDAAEAPAESVAP
jgi:hypothetical protein